MIYQNGDRCPCCGTILTGKSRAWLAEFSLLVNELGLPEWPGLAESWDADVMNEEAPKTSIVVQKDLIDRAALLRRRNLLEFDREDTGEHVRKEFVWAEDIRNAPAVARSTEEILWK